jgi:hypothetical protein
MKRGHHLLRALAFDADTDFQQSGGEMAASPVILAW